jgi:hypothetical protein
MHVDSIKLLEQVVENELFVTSQNRRGNLNCKEKGFVMVTIRTQPSIVISASFLYPEGSLMGGLPLRGS